MRTTFVAATGLLMVSVVVQFYFAAFGVFEEPATDDQFILHQMNGRFVLPLLCLLVIAAAALARAPGRLIGLSAVPLGLLTVQIALFFVTALTGATEYRSTVAGQAILGLHALNGLAILAVSILLFVRARRFLASAAARTQAAPDAPSGAAPENTITQHPVAS